MTFAVQPASVSPTSRAGAHAGTVERREFAAEPRLKGAAPESRVPNSRNALVAALRQAVQSLAPAVAEEPAATDADGSPIDEGASKQAFHAFVHALFVELRPSDAEGRHGRGFAWGRASAGDLAHRLEALVQRLKSGTQGDTAAAPAADSSAALASDAIAVPASDSTPAPATDAVTPDASSLAVASPLLSAFRRLVIDPDGATGGIATDARDALVALLQRVSSALAGDAAAPATGSLIDVTI